MSRPARASRKAYTEWLHTRMIALCVRDSIRRTYIILEYVIARESRECGRNIGTAITVRVTDA